MDTIELKKNFHHLTDTIGNDNFLAKFYSIMVRVNERREGKLWARLSEAERDELLKVEIESNDPENLISHRELGKKHNKWL